MDDGSYHDLSAVFPWGLSDPAFFHALCYATLVVERGGTLAPECLAHKGKALRLVNDAITSVSAALSEQCMGTILVLAGAAVSLIRIKVSQELISAV